MTLLKLPILSTTENRGLGGVVIQKILGFLVLPLLVVYIQNMYIYIYIYISLYIYTQLPDISIVIYINNNIPLMYHSFQLILYIYIYVYIWWIYTNYFTFIISLVLWIEPAEFQDFGHGVVEILKLTDRRIGSPFCDSLSWMFGLYLIEITIIISQVQ